jgi:repressor LexA
MPQLPTKRQKQLLDYIAAYIERRGYSPTYEEMGRKLGVSSVATIFCHLRELAKKRLIKIYKGAVRGVELLNSPPASSLSPLNLELPLLGYIAAGRPIEVVTQTETILAPANLISHRREAFVLKVRGDSMIEEGILDGDYVVVEKQETAENGDIVVALLENSLATLKKFYKEKDRIRLEPANAQMAPIYATNVKIQGKVRGLIRRFA